MLTAAMVITLVLGGSMAATQAHNECAKTPRHQIDAEGSVLKCKAVLAYKD